MARALLTLHAVDLEAAANSFRRKPLVQLIGALPRGRVAAVCAGLELDLTRAAADQRKHRRTMFEAIVEDQARASLWDVPRDAFDDAAELIGLGDFAKGRPAYPSELDETAGGTLVIWCDDLTKIGGAETRLRKALEQPPSALVTADPVLAHDIRESLATLLAAALKPGVAVVIEQ